MGSDVSKSNITSIPGPVTYFSIILKDPDKLHLVPYDNNIAELVVRALDEHHSVQEHHPISSQVYLIKVAGSPFSTTAMADSEHTLIEMKLSWCKMFSLLGEQGWRVVTTTSLSQRRSGSTVFFRKMVGEFAPEPLPRPFLCLTTSTWDKLMLLNLPGTLESKVNQLVETGWGVQSAKLLEKNKMGCVLQLKLVGSPWSGTNGETNIQIRKLIVDLVKLLQTHGFNFVAKVNFNRCTDSLFFQSDVSPFSLSSAEEMFCLSLNKSDRLRVVGAPADVLHSLPGLIQQSWPYGIKQVREYFTSQEYKLGGSPWWSEGEDSFHAKRLISTVIAGLKFSGWDVLLTMKISSILEDKSIIILQQRISGPRVSYSTSTSAVQPMVDWVSLSFHGGDRIRLCSGPGAKTSSHEAIAMSIRKQLNDSEFLQKEVEKHQNVEFKLYGNPFGGVYGTGDEQRTMLLYLSRLLQDFNRNGWKLCASLDISSKYHANKREKFKEDCDCWIFIEEPSDRLHLAALNPPSIARYLGKSREELSGLSSQFD